MRPFIKYRLAFVLRSPTIPKFITVEKVGDWLVKFYALATSKVISVQAPFWEIGESEDRGLEFGARGFETWSSQTKDLKLDTCRFLFWRPALLR